jgi:peptide-methionine (S)-S-oxide reductase
MATTMKIRLTLIIALLTSSCATDELPKSLLVTSPASKTPPQAASNVEDKQTKPKSKELATFGAGCFWCVEAVLEQLPGVSDVTSGYMGGQIDNPTYRQVCKGTSGHAEVVQVEFDPDKISFETLLKWFFKLHDPTTLNSQGLDVGTQYRSVIFFHSEAQKAAAHRAKQIIDEAKVFADPIVTEISPAVKYYLGEGEHQDFYRLNKTNGYCRAVITPKLDKLGLDK